MEMRGTTEVQRAVGWQWGTLPCWGLQVGSERHYTVEGLQAGKEGHHNSGGGPVGWERGVPWRLGVGQSSPSGGMSSMQKGVERQMTSCMMMATL